MENIALLYSELQRFKKNPDDFNAAQKNDLLKQTDECLTDFINDKIEFGTDAAPELLMFLQKAAAFESLQPKAKAARKKLQQKLNDFDRRYGLDALDDIPQELIEKNIDKIGVLAQMPFKSRPAFKQLFEIISKIDLTDENGNSLGEEGHDRIETTVIELAKTDTFFSLLGAKNLDLELYLNVLHDAVQVNLIGLLYTEEIAKHYPLSDDMKQKAADYMQKLVELIK